MNIIYVSRGLPNVNSTGGRQPELAADPYLILGQKLTEASLEDSLRTHLFVCLGQEVKTQGKGSTMLRFRHSKISAKTVRSPRHHSRLLAVHTQSPTYINYNEPLRSKTDCLKPFPS
jgi:hypothetical protein